MCSQKSEIKSTDLLKAFNTISHDLLIAKLHAYGLCGTSFKLIRDYLSNRFQRIKVNGTYNTWEEHLMGLPQGSVLGPLLFSIYLNVMFYVIKRTEICQFAW